jgi:hypothetical protein
MKTDRWTDITLFTNLLTCLKRGDYAENLDALRFSQIVVHEVINSLSFLTLPHSCTLCHV